MSDVELIECSEHGSVLNTTTFRGLGLQLPDIDETTRGHRLSTTISNTSTSAGINPAVDPLP